MTIKITEKVSGENRVYPIWKGKESVETRHLPGDLRAAVEADGDFLFRKGKSKIYLTEGSRAAVLYLGELKNDELPPSTVRAYVKRALAFCKGSFINSAEIALYPEQWGLEREKVLYTGAETLRLLDYSYELFKKKQDDEKSFKVEELSLVVDGGFAGADELLERSETMAEAVFFARDLVNGPANFVTVDKVAEEVEALCKETGLKLTVFGEKELEERGMGLHLAVGRASVQESKLLEVEYRPQGEDNDLPTVCLVGKGVVYDSGGLYLKPGSSMDTMKSDMAGAAVTAAVIGAVARLKLPINVTALIPLAENSIGPNAYRPGDVITGFKGKHVEIRSTDAEGRLLLADALSYSDYIKPDLTIDIATLTGSIVSALGSRITGFFSRNSKVSDALRSASKATGEDMWEMPLSDHYKEYFKSDIADMTNSAIPRREVGSVTAALFLGEFVDSDNWVHIDIAGTAFLSSEWDIHPKGATGIMVRTLTDFLTNFDKDSHL